MKIIKEIILSLLLSNSILSSVLIIKYFIIWLILGKFEHNIKHLYYIVFLLICTVVFLGVFQGFEIMNDCVMLSRVVKTIFFISIILFALYASTLDFYTLQKFNFEKADLIYTKLSYLSKFSFLSALFVEISHLLIFKKI